MNVTNLISCIFVSTLLLTGCVTKKKYSGLDSDYSNAITKLSDCESQLSDAEKQLRDLDNNLRAEINRSQLLTDSKDETIADLRAQINDLKKQRDKQFNQVDDLTVLSQSANDNINQTIKQLEKKDTYIKYLLAAKTKADSLNIALSVSLKSELKKGIEDKDIEVKVDKTVVFINLSDKMLFQSGSYRLTSRANEVLTKVADIIKSKPELELMVEGYTDNVPINSNCIEDNWDLSAKRATAVVRVLQNKYGVDPSKLIAAGRGEYNTLADNNTAEGRSINRRTRIILLPKLNQFYDLLEPAN